MLKPITEQEVEKHIEKEEKMHQKQIGGMPKKTEASSK